MKDLVTRPWFAPTLGAIVYVAGFNDELLHVIGLGWVKLGRWVQTAVVVVVLLLVVYFVVVRLRDRRSFYDAAVRAAAHADRSPSTVESHTGEGA